MTVANLPSAKTRGVVLMGAEDDFLYVSTGTVWKKIPLEAL